MLKAPFPISIRNESGRVRELLRGDWCGDTFYCFDALGHGYELVSRDPQTYEEIPSGELWDVLQVEVSRG